MTDDAEEDSSGPTFNVPDSSDEQVRNTCEPRVKAAGKDQARGREQSLLVHGAAIAYMLLIRAAQTEPRQREGGTFGSGWRLQRGRKTEVGLKRRS